MHIFTFSPILALVALSTIIGGSVIAVPEPEFSLPKTEPVSFIKKVEATCLDQRLKPRFDYHSSCFARVVMEYTDISD